MKLAIDLDGVLVNFCAGATKILKHLYPRFIDVVGDICPKRWDWLDLLTQQEFNEMWETIVERPDFWKSLPPIPHNCFALQQVAHEVDVYYLTARPPTGGVSAERQTAEWMHSMHMDWGHIIVVPDSYAKLGIIRNLGVDGFLDDKPDIVQLTKYYTKSYLLRQPYNAHDRVQLKVPSVGDVKEFIQRVQEMPSDGE